MIAVGEGERIVNVVEVDVLVEGNFVEGGDSIVVGVLRGVVQEEERTAAGAVEFGLRVRREIFRGELEPRFSKITTRIVIFSFNLRE